MKSLLIINLMEKNDDWGWGAEQKNEETKKDADDDFVWGSGAQDNTGQQERTTGESDVQEERPFERGRGRGDRKPMKCFNCGEEGHGSRNCPNPKQERPPRACFKCGEQGHKSFECP